MYCETSTTWSRNFNDIILNYLQERLEMKVFKGKKIRGKMRPMVLVITLLSLSRCINPTVYIYFLLGLYSYVVTLTTKA